MPSPSIPDPDLPPPVLSTPGVVRAQPDDRSFETDFCALAARFARSGKTAPELGSPLGAASGLSAECIRTRQTQRCDDVEADPRADVEASRQLGVLSVLVMPLLNGDELAGVFEIFSSRTYAFGDREERALEALAHQTLQSLQLAAEPLPLSAEDLAAVEPGDEVPEEELLEDAVKAEGTADFPRRRFDGGTRMWAAAVVACALLLAIVVVTPLEWRKPGARAVTSLASVYADGKEIFHLPPARAQAQADEAEQGTAMPLAAADKPEEVVELSSETVSAIVVKSVQPAYPEDARRRHIQGPVVLDIRIASSGDVQNVRAVSGMQVLAKAAEDAMKQWRFKPRTVDGRAVEMQTRVTLQFRLPQ